MVKIGFLTLKTQRWARNFKLQFSDIKFIVGNLIGFHIKLTFIGEKSIVSEISQLAQTYFLDFFIVTYVTIASIHLA
jgi:hypothetical protein